MANKKWHTITVECIKFQSGCTCKVGDVLVLAKVSSSGNAYVCAKALSQIYQPEYFKISIK